MSKVSVAVPTHGTERPSQTHLSPTSARVPASSSQPVVAQDRYYGHRAFAQVAERYVIAHFACASDSMATTPDASSGGAPRLAYFIAYALYRTRLPMLISYHALLLLKRLKTRYPVARGSSGHRLFISAFMLAAKMVCDDAYNNKSWTIVCQGLFSQREVNQMERELLGYLDLHINATPEEITDFAAELELYGAPRMSLRALNELQLPVSRAGEPAGTSVRSTADASATASTAAAAAVCARRSQSTHRRCVSLKPDFWTHHGGNAANATQAQSADGGAAGPVRNGRPVLRASMPSHRVLHSGAANMTATTTVPPYPTHAFDPSGETASLYTMSNASSASLQTPGSLSSSARPTPSTSLSELGASPWPEMPDTECMPPVPGMYKSGVAEQEMVFSRQETPQAWRS